MQLVRARDALLHAANPDRAISKGDVVDADERDLTPAQAVTVDEVEQQPIPNVLPRDRGEEPFDLLFRYVAHAGRARRRDISFFRHKAGESDAFQHFRQSGRGRAGASAVWRTSARRARAFGVIAVLLVLVCAGLVACTGDQAGRAALRFGGLERRDVGVALGDAATTLRGLGRHPVALFRDAEDGRCDAFSGREDPLEAAHLPGRDAAARGLVEERRHRIEGGGCAIRSRCRPCERGRRCDHEGLRHFAPPFWSIATSRWSSCVRRWTIESTSWTDACMVLDAPSTRASWERWYSARPAP